MPGTSLSVLIAVYGTFGLLVVIDLVIELRRGRAQPADDLSAIAHELAAAVRKQWQD